MTYLLKEGLPYIMWKLFEANQNPLELRECWVCKDARNFIQSIITKDFEVFEFGGGGSTLYFSDNCKSVETIENNLEWIEKINSKLINSNQKFVKEIPNKLYDLILIDDGNRLQNFELAKTHLKPNGIIIFDNIDRYEVKEKPKIVFKGYSKGNSGITHTGVFQYA